MSFKNHAPVRVLLYEGTGAEPLNAAERYSTLVGLLERGFAVTRTAAEKPVEPVDAGQWLVLGKFPAGNPATRLAHAVAPAPALVFQDLAQETPAQWVEQAERARAQLAGPGTNEWKPWFPVIDYDRCTNCMQCLSFCLFGVYGVDGGGKIQAQNQDQCKTNCPACSRVCPEAAIMFPKYKTGPINGDVVSAEDLDREKMKIDISALLGGDVYTMLRERSDRAKSRFSKERDANKALQERQKCLTKLAQAGDIPAEVLMSLPSPDEIARRAAEAKARAEAALQANGGPGLNPAHS